MASRTKKKAVETPITITGQSDVTEETSDLCPIPLTPSQLAEAEAAELAADNLGDVIPHEGESAEAEIEVEARYTETEAEYEERLLAEAEADENGEAANILRARMDAAEGKPAEAPPEAAAPPEVQPAPAPEPEPAPVPQPSKPSNAITLDDNDTDVMVKLSKLERKSSQHWSDHVNWSEKAKNAKKSHESTREEICTLIRKAQDEFPLLAGKHRAASSGPPDLVPIRREVQPAPAPEPPNAPDEPLPEDAAAEAEPFEGDAKPEIDDEAWKKVLLSHLGIYGIQAKDIKSLASADIFTLGDFSAYNATGVPLAKISGIGAAAVARITSSVNAWFNDNPQRLDEPEEAPNAHGFDEDGAGNRSDPNHPDDGLGDDADDDDPDLDGEIDDADDDDDDEDDDETDETDEIDEDDDDMGDFDPDDQ